MYFSLFSLRSASSLSFLFFSASRFSRSSFSLASFALRSASSLSFLFFSASRFSRSSFSLASFSLRSASSLSFLFLSSSRLSRSSFSLASFACFCASSFSFIFFSSSSDSFDCQLLALVLSSSERSMASLLSTPDLVPPDLYTMHSLLFLHWQHLMLLLVSLHASKHLRLSLTWSDDLPQPLENSPLKPP